MEFLFELLFEFFFEGAYALMGENKVPLGLRVLIAVIFFSVYVALFGVLMYGAISTKHPVPIVLMALIIVGVTAMVVIAIAKQFKKHTANPKTRDK